METTTITNEISIIDNSIIETGIETADSDDNGYLVNNGTNRSLYWAKQAGQDNVWLLIIRTNGDDILVTEQDIVECCETMTDNDGDHPSNTMQGRQRLLDALDSCPDNDSRDCYEQEICCNAHTITMKCNNWSQICESNDLEEAKEEADEHLTYCQQNMYLTDESDNELACRNWWGCLSGIEEEENPVSFGDFGFYGDWND